MTADERLKSVPTVSIRAISLYESAASRFLTPKEEEKPRNGKKASLNRDSERLERLKRENNDVLKEKFFEWYGFPNSTHGAVDWIQYSSGLTKTDKLIELTVASYYNVRLGYAYPTQQQLALLTGVNETKVREAIKRMKASGRWLVVPSNSYAAVGRSTRYYILPPFGYGQFTGGAVETDPFSGKKASSAVGQINLILQKFKPGAKVGSTNNPKVGGRLPGQSQILEHYKGSDKKTLDTTSYNKLFKDLVF